MPRKLYERALQRGLEDGDRERIEKILETRLAELPLTFRTRWQADGRVLSLESTLVSWEVRFGDDLVEVFGRPSLAGRLLDTPENRARLTGVLDEVMEELDI